MDNDIGGGAGGGLGAGLSGLSDDQLTVGFDDALAASRHAEWARLAFETEIGRRRLYATDGTASLSEWITLRAGEGQPAGHHHAILARRLPDFPGVDAALAEGRISAAHAGWLITLAGLTDTGDAELVALGEAHTVPELQAACRAARRLRRRADNAAHARRFLRWRTGDDGTVYLHGRLHGADGLTVTTAVAARAENAAPDPADPTPEAFDTRCADALVELCAHPDRARPEVVIHVPLAALTPHPHPDRHHPDPDPDDQHGEACEEPTAASGGVGMTWDATPLSEPALRRLLCDSGLRLTLDDPAGRAVGIGRRSRAIPAWLLSQLRWRDGGCRFPGCEHTHWLHGHHLVHWPDGGPTDLANLVLTCSRHHRYLHEGGWRLHGHPDTQLTYTAPTGHTYTSHPAHRPRPRRRHPPLRRTLTQTADDQTTQGPGCAHG